MRCKLYYLFEAVTLVVETGSLYAGVYKASHEQFKAMYAQNFRGKDSAMDGLLAMQSNRCTEALDMGFIQNRFGRKYEYHY